ncbi:hypothetical protein BD289DRAFT_161340 [Coniella lustricola]|uniref:Uncharacterized protein n=1 Tax=Coniella lustricola TaxID=2025994 RepID=A0A2T2ZUD5_9PEZI|nr:hypothetical protein BD289DRAFT_161340 [Coniella lustricola]
MMEESAYHDEGALDETLFHFDNEQEEAAAMDHLNAMEPQTPPRYSGFADPSASAAAVAVPTGPPLGQRLHPGPANAWDQSSPPDLSYSPSPGPTSAFQYRQRQVSAPRSEHDLHDHHDHHDQHAQHAQHRTPAASAGLHEDGRQAYRPPQHRSQARYSPDLIADLDPDPLDQYPGLQRTPHRAPSRTHRPKSGARRKTSDVVTQRAEQWGLQDGAQAGVEQHRDSTQDATRDGGSRARLDEYPQGTSAASQRSGKGGGKSASTADDQEYVVIPEEEVLEMMYNGDEESRVTAERLRAQVVQAAVQNGKVLLMVTKATGQWWTGNEMRQRRRAVASSVYNTAGQVLSGAGHVIMTSTPLGGFYDSMSTNLSLFRAAPLSYTLQGLRVGIGGRTQCDPSPPPQPEVEDMLINVAEDEDGFVDMFSEEF